jgi:CBS domain-containing protein
MAVIRDIMSRHVVAVRPETTLAEAAEIFAHHPIGGAPVVAANGKLVGVISEPELIDIVFEAAAKYAPV